MWRERFGLDKPPLDRAKLYLWEPDAWMSMSEDEFMETTLYHSPLNQGLLPGMDLARVDFKPAGQLCNGVLPLERGQSHFGLEDWAVLLTCLLHVLLLLSVLF